MAQKIKFSINSSGANFLHEDFIMEIPLLSYKFDFDTYYLALGKFIDNESQLVSIVSNYLNRCKKAILSLSKTQFIFLPIDFSDQYYGAFKVTHLNEELFKFEYGIVEKTLKVLYQESDEFRYLEISDEKFDVDFELLLTSSDIMDSFYLSS